MKKSNKPAATREAMLVYKFDYSWSVVKKLHVEIEHYDDFERNYQCIQKCLSLAVCPGTPRTTSAHIQSKMRRAEEQWEYPDMEHIAGPNEEED